MAIKIVIPYLISSIIVQRGSLVATHVNVLLINVNIIQRPCAGRVPSLVHRTAARGAAELEGAYVRVKFVKICLIKVNLEN